MNLNNNLKIAVFGGGCFWCTEAIFERFQGVVDVESGYSGGTIPDPAYEEVCGGATGHAEVIRITYDPAAIKYSTLLEIFFATHDPTTPNRQGADTGTQYRSVIFYADNEQKAAAEEYIRKLDASGEFDSPIVTELSPLKEFYRAEGYHQEYFRNNPEKGYCRSVIAPKVQKLLTSYGEMLKYAK